MATMVAATVVIVFVLAMTRAGRDIDAATQRFMLFYAGVFALIGLTGSVMVGLVATDRIVMTPGHRVMAQAVHRAASFGALAFLVIHIVTEILAQRVHVLDAFIPFLSPFRTFYIGLGTIASDLILLIVITSILRKRFTTHGKAWRWRAIHYSAYVAFVFGVLHGLLGGREAKPYVDWSYGFAIALVALGLAVRFLATSLRPQENLSSAPGADRPRAPGASPLHTAAMSMAQAQLGGTVQVLPAGMGARGPGFGAQGTGPWAATALSATPAWSSPSGPLPLAALEAAPVYAAESSSGAYPSYASAEAYPADSYRPAEAYRDLGFTPLGAPPYGDDAPVGFGGRPYVPAAYVPADPPRPALPGSAGAAGGRRPLYEPGYDGPPRFEGAPRGHVPQDELSSYPYDMPGRSQPATGSAGDYVLSGDYASESSGPGRPRPNRAIEAPGARSGQPVQGRPGDRNTGPTPRAGTGPMPRVGTGPMPRLDTGPMPRAGNGQPPRNGTGPTPRTGASPAPRADSGPMPRAGTGPMPRAGTGPMPRAATGPVPRAATGPVPRPDTGPIPRLGAGQVPQAGAGPMPRTGTGPMPRADSGPMPRMGTGPMPRADSGPMPRMGTGPMPRADSGPMPRMGTGPMPRADSGPMPRAGTGPMPRPDTGPMPRVGPGSASRGGPASAARPDTGPIPRAPLTGPPGPPAESAPGPRSGRPPRAAGPTSHRKNSADPRYREVSGPTGGDEWR